MLGKKWLFAPFVISLGGQEAPRGSSFADVFSEVLVTQGCRDPPLCFVSSLLWSSILRVTPRVSQSMFSRITPCPVDGGPCCVVWQGLFRADAAHRSLLSHSSYDDRSSDRRVYDRRYYGSYRRNGCSRDRGEAYCEPDYRHSYEYHREDSSYRSQRSSRRKHRRRRRRSRTFSRSSSVSAGPGPSPPLSFSPLGRR